MAGIKASFRNITDDDKRKFNSQDCLLTISVGQGYHEGELFETSIKLIVSTFRSCTIILYDSLQRYTMALSKNASPDFFYKAAIREGDLWIERNKKYFSHYPMIQLPVQRWDQWLSHSQYSYQQQKIKDMLSSDSSYQLAFETTTNEYLLKYTARNGIDINHADYNRLKQLCFDYLIEECTVLCLWIDTNAHYEIYPAARNPAMTATHERFIQSKHPDLLRSLGFKFRNHPQLMPQQFVTLNNFEEQTI